MLVNEISRINKKYLFFYHKYPIDCISLPNHDIYLISLEYNTITVSMNEMFRKSGQSSTKIFLLKNIIYYIN